MKSKIIIINALFAIVDAFLIITGYLNFNSIFHNHIITLLVVHGDGYLGLFWLLCFVQDLLILNLLILIFYFIKKLVVTC